VSGIDGPAELERELSTAGLALVPERFPHLARLGPQRHAVLGVDPPTPGIHLAIPPWSPSLCFAVGPHSRLAGTTPGDLVGRSVRAVFVAHGPEQKVPFFELDDT
jgi:hypothetical protein